MNKLSRSYQELFHFCQSVPIIDTHDHTSCLGPRYTDPIQVVVYGYMISDLTSATSEEEANTLINYAIPWQQRWPILEKAWKRTCHTGYAQVTKRLLKHFYQVEDVSFKSLERIQDHLMNLEDEGLFEDVLAEANIVMRLQNILDLDASSVLDGSLKLTPRSCLVIPLPDYHNLKTRAKVEQMVSPLNKPVETIDEYINACEEIFRAFKNYGAVSFKDQSAYVRSLDYGIPSYARARDIFDWLIDNPNQELSQDEAIILSDYLFSEFLNTAKELQLPVQIHTGLLDRMYGDIRGTNAAHLIPIIDAHRETQFDLLHASWPYSGEILFMAKNFPNIAINFCWTHMIDPVYAQTVMRQSIASVPHCKIHGFGSDHGGHSIPPKGGRPDRVWAAAQITRENICFAMSSMVDQNYLSLGSAKEIICFWLFSNPNEFYNLNLDIEDWIN